jgi:2-dehydro-3-deoxyphosphogluconate aldolase / (4S)-4-hydroxy-2-oxoglutarate aldolase
MSSSLTSALRQHALVPVIAIENADQGADLAAALVDGGLPVAEVTFRTAAAESVIRTMASRGDMLVGAGTVLTKEQADRAKDAGATFAVSPGFDPRIVDHCQNIGLPIFPGVITPSDICAALAHGLTSLKFFPAESFGGISTLKALAAPFGDIQFMPTGGISVENLASYLAFDRVIACGGSWMVAPKLYADGNFDAVRTAVAEAVALAKSCKK